MRTKTITRAIVAVILMATITTSTGCKSKRSGGGGCGSLMPDSHRNQEVTKLA